MWDQKCLILVFLGYNFKKLLSHLKLASSIIYNESLTHTVSFGVRSSFSKGPESAFSEGPGSGPGPLYKVYLLNSCGFKSCYKNEKKYFLIKIQCPTFVG